MHNSEYISCGRLQNGIDFELDNIELCCYRCHDGGGNINLASIVDGNIDFDAFFINRDKYIEENKNGNINSKCKGCFNLEKKKWDDDEQLIKYIHFNHWTHCNSDCIYCYTKDSKYKSGTQHYHALPILKEILKRVKFSPDGEITFAGGEPTLLDEFDEIIEYLLEIGAKKIIVHTSGIKYSPALEKGISENKIQVVISQDAGFDSTYNKIKNNNNFNSVWKNTKKYSSFQNGNKNVFSKYVIIPNLNDNKNEIDEWLKKSALAGVKSVIVDIEHNYYANNKDNFKNAYKLLSLCEYIKTKALFYDMTVQFYNTAKYLYDKYKLIVPFVKYKHYFIELMILSIPLLVGNLGHTLIGATDIFVVSKYNIESLAAISIANSILFTIFILGIGIQAAISIILSNKRGKKEGIKKYLLSNLVFSAFVAAIFTLICYMSSFVIDKLSFEPWLVPLIKDYIKIVSFSMFGMFIYQGIKEFLLAYEIVNFPNMILLGAVVVNLIMDFILVLGCGIIPAMGTKGAAFATFGVRSLMGLVLLIYVFRFIDFKEKLDFSFMKQVVRIGTPIGLALMIEFLAFNIITVLVGREAGILSATHSILITISSLTFTVPLSIATAVSIKVSYNYGAKKAKEIKNYSYMGLFMGVSFMAFCSLILALFPSELVRIFTDNEEVLKIAMPIVILAAMYQVFDGFQVITGGILKGFKLTNVVTASVLIGYWLVGMPVAYILVWHHGYSLRGYWIGLAVSLLFMGLYQAIAAKNKFNEVKKVCSE